ncbi:MAG: hypothetical protein SPI12_00645 [Actinomycetaceae bacterium]|nr:hypothetical protein [Actinomycetaceae bacterium]MDY6082359.1 hypothetical protein [Actinomycetaceae bacterium]
MRITPMRVVWCVLALLVGACAIAAARPDVIPALRAQVLEFPWVFILSFRGAVAAVEGVVALFFLIFGLIRYLVMNRGRVAALFGILMVIAAALNVGVVASRGMSYTSSMASDPGVTPRGRGDGSITVMEYNTYGKQGIARQVSDVVEKSGVDVVSLPETSTATAKSIVQDLAARGADFQLFDTGTSQWTAPYNSTALLVSTDLGTYVGARVEHGVQARPQSGTGLTFVAVHVKRPEAGNLAQWRHDVTQVYRSQQQKNTVVLGDFNSTVDHQDAVLLGAANSYADAAVQAGVGGAGTWPAALHPLLAAPIDRVLIHQGAGYRGVTGRVQDVGSSDHRALLIRLSPTV